jgi:hypothetical protein
LRDHLPFGLALRRFAEKKLLHFGLEWVSFESVPA